MTYELLFHKDWDKYFEKLDKSIQKKIGKKIIQLKEGSFSKHLKYGIGFFVVKSGQFRICFKVEEKNRKIKLFFAGKHKDYEKWIKEQ